MTTYNTGNPIGSTDARDLYDNAQNLDNFINGAAASYTDRLGVSRRSLAGIDAAADNVLNSIGYAVPVAYASGISLTLTSQTVEYSGVVYAPKSSALPFTTSSWGTDSARFRAIQVTDAAYLSYTTAGTGAAATTVQSKLREIRTPADFTQPWSARVLDIQQKTGQSGETACGGMVLGYTGDYDANVIGAGSMLVSTYSGATLKNRMPGSRDLRTIVGGYDNEISAGTIGDSGGLACAIFASHHSTISGDATHGVITGGSYHTISGGDYNAIGGGQLNVVTGGTDYGTIAGGGANEVNMASGNDYGTIGGGFNNTVSGRFAGVFCGNTNVASGAYSFVSSGSSNTASGQYSAVVGGTPNTAAGDYSAIVGGNSITITGATNGGYSGVVGGLSNTIASSASSRFSGMVGGRSNTVNAEYAAAIGGRENTVTGEASVAIGYGAVAATPGMVGRAGGYFASAGDAQASHIVMRRQTTDATPTELRAGSALGTRLLLVNDSTYAFSILVVARNTDAEEGAAYKLDGCISVTAAGSTALIGSVTKTVLAESIAAWDANALADGTNKALQISVTGEAAKTINWVADVQLVKVTA